MTTTTTETHHAKDNAAAWMETIGTAWETARFCADKFQGRWLSRDAKAMLKELGFDGTNHDQVLEAIEQQSRESALSVDIRSGWLSPGETALMEFDEFRIVLTTGGPALQIRGELNHGEPARCWLEYQDWGTPWMQFFGADRDALVWFAGLFWFGE